MFANVFVKFVNLKERTVSTYKFCSRTLLMRNTRRRGGFFFRGIQLLCFFRMVIIFKFRNDTFSGQVASSVKFFEDVDNVLNYLTC